MKTLPVGCDIGGSAVRAAQLVVETDGSVRLQNWAEVPLPEGAIGSNSTIEDSGAVAEAVADVLQRLGLRKQLGGIPVVVNMPPGLCAMALSKKSERLLKDQARARRAATLYAAQFATTAPLDQIDKCSILTKPWGSDYFLVVKSLRDQLLARMRVCQRAGANVVIEPEPCALLRSLPGAGAVLDIGLHRSTLVVASADGLPLWRMFGFGSASLADRVAAGSVGSRRTAEWSQLAHDADQDGSARWLMDQFYGDVVEAVQKLVREENVAIAQITLTGNGARLPDLATRLSSRTLLPVIIADLEVVRAPAIPRAVLADLGPSYSMAVGLALWDHRIVASEEQAPAAMADVPVAV